jgi:NADH-quinone oxidoreductase subunit L
VLAAFGFALQAVLHLASLPEDSRRFTELAYTWMSVGDFKVDVSFLMDPLSAVMVLVVTGVGSLIHIYATGYMSHDPSYRRFFMYLNLFMFSMLTLVLADNYLLMFVGWEGVGLCSYLLIGFWYERPAASQAGKKAFIVNRIGDFGFMLGMFMLVVATGSLDYEQVFGAAEHGAFVAGGTAITLATLLMFLGATGKSAQIPLFTWLPDAMEGPTPVSALIHAATMVTAGVYMLARSHVLFELAPTTMEVVALIGAMTALLAATIGLAQNDIKRVLAYSTVSQLGYMFMACGVGAFGAGIFHVMTHAFFKALLFLGAGSVIHAMSDEQDMRRMGGLAGSCRTRTAPCSSRRWRSPACHFLSGFFSKDEILHSAFASGHLGIWLAGVVGAAMTAFYMTRLYVLTFRGPVAALARGRAPPARVALLDDRAAHDPRVPEHRRRLRRHAVPGGRARVGALAAPGDGRRRPRGRAPRGVAPHRVGADRAVGGCRGVRHLHGAALLPVDAGPRDEPARALLGHAPPVREQVVGGRVL